MTDEEKILSDLKGIAEYFMELYREEEDHHIYDQHYDRMVVVSNACNLIEELLKEQEPRVLTADEIIKTAEVTTCYIEVKGERNLYGAYLQKYDDDHTLIATDLKDVPEMIATRHARLWSSRPTDEQREAVKWE